MGADDALREILVDNVIVPLTKKYGKSFCSLTENKAGYSVEIRCVPNDALVFNCDSFPNAGGVFFRGENDECKRADYVLISESERIVMIFELKHSGKASSGKKAAQLKGAKCILDYCASISSAFLEEHDIFDGFAIKYYKGRYKSSQKRAFAKDNNPDNTSPETARILPGKSISFEWLLQ